MKYFKILTALCCIIAMLFTGCGISENSMTNNNSNNEDSNESISVSLLVDDSNHIIDENAEIPYIPRIASITDKGIEVYWKRPEYAEGFEIYRSYKEDSGYELIADVPNDNSWSYFDTDFDTSQMQIYYTVSCYETNEEGNRIYSDFSSIMCANYRSVLTLNRTRYFLASGSSRALEAYYAWGNAHNVTWSSDDESIAYVDSDGTVNAVSQGTCTITCYSDELGEEAFANIIVDREATSMLDTYTSRFVESKEDMWSNPSAEKTNNAVIMMVGDLMCMGKQQRAQMDDSGEFNFNESYDYVKDLFNSSDYTIGNLETVVDSCWPYYMEEANVDSYPNCNAPARILDAIKYAGIDGVITANNHNCDAGIHGVTETINQLDRYEIGNTGTFSSATDNRTMIADVNGIKIGFLSYASEFNTKDSTWQQEDIDTYLNYYDEEKAINDVATLKSQGAEYIIVYIHWGIKNHVNYNKEQTVVAQQLADMGVDYICGSHPHVLQAYDEIKASDGRIVPCIYSLGDFNSSINQIPGNRDTIILRIELSKDDAGNVTLEQNNYIPCYTYTEYADKSYVTIPLNPKFNGGLSDLKRYNKFRKRISDILGNKISEYMP